MSTPEALRLADWLEDQYDPTYNQEQAAAELRRQRAEIERLTAEKLELLRWKGTHAPRLVAVEGLLREAQHEAAARREAIANLASLDSERQANAMLTAEVERLTAERDALRAVLAEADRLAGHDDSMTEWRERCAHLWAGAAPLPFDWPKLTKPAKVGGGTFNVGVSARLVVEAAQRQHEYAEAEGRKTPEEWQQVERARRELWDMLNGSPAPAPLTDEQMRDALRQCPHDTVEALRVRWLYAKDFARAIELAHGIGTDARAQAQGGKP